VPGRRRLVTGLRGLSGCGQKGEKRARPRPRLTSSSKPFPPLPRRASYSAREVTFSASVTDLCVVGRLTRCLERNRGQKKELSLSLRAHTHIIPLGLLCMYVGKERRRRKE